MLSVAAWGLGHTETGGLSRDSDVAHVHVWPVREDSRPGGPEVWSWRQWVGRGAVVGSFAPHSIASVPSPGAGPAPTVLSSLPSWGAWRTLLWLRDRLAQTGPRCVGPARCPARALRLLAHLLTPSWSTTDYSLTKKGNAGSSRLTPEKLAEGARTVPIPGNWGQGQWPPYLWFGGLAVHR